MWYLIFWTIPLLVWLVVLPDVRSSSRKLQVQIQEVIDMQARGEFEEGFKELLLKIKPVSGKQLRTFTIKKPVPEIPDSFQECRNVFHFHLIPSRKERRALENSFLPLQIAPIIIGLLFYLTINILHGYYFFAANFLLASILSVFVFKSLFRAASEAIKQEDELLKQVDTKATAFLTETRVDKEE